MPDSKVKVIIPFRDRGLDPRRGANLDVVMGWWFAHGFDPCVISDGLSGDEQFNRHRAYNRAVAAHPDTQVFVFTEADMLIHPDQIKVAVLLAAQNPGLVVPFTQYRYLSDSMTEVLRDDYRDSDTEKIASWWERDASDPTSLFNLTAEKVMDNGKSIGAVNVVSRNTLDVTGGFTEATSGNWYDDNIINEGFAYLTGRETRYVTGPAVHLYHLPGHTGKHLTRADKNATHANKIILNTMRRHIQLDQVALVQQLMEVRK